MTPGLPRDVGAAGMDAVLLKHPSKGTCGGLRGPRVAGQRGRPRGSSWAPSAPPLSFQEGVNSPPFSEGWI